MKLFAILVLIFVVALVIAQPAQTPTPETSSSANLRASAAEARALACELEAKVSARLRESAESELVQERVQLGKVTEQLGAARANSAILVASNKSAQGKITEMESSLGSANEKLSKALSRIKSANGRVVCDFLGVFCVPEK